MEVSEVKSDGSAQKVSAALSESSTENENKSEIVQNGDEKEVSVTATISVTTQNNENDEEGDVEYIEEVIEEEGDEEGEEETVTTYVTETRTVRGNVENAVEEVTKSVKEKLKITEQKDEDEEAEEVEEVEEEEEIEESEEPESSAVVVEESVQHTFVLNNEEDEQTTANEVKAEESETVEQSVDSETESQSKSTQLLQSEQQHEQETSTTEQPKVFDDEVQLTSQPSERKQSIVYGNVFSSAATAPAASLKPIENRSEIKQESIRNQLKDIISDIDRVLEKDDTKFGRTVAPAPVFASAPVYGSAPLYGSAPASAPVYGSTQVSAPVFGSPQAPKQESYTSEYSSTVTPLPGGGTRTRTNESSTKTEVIKTTTTRSLLQPANDRYYQEDSTTTTSTSKPIDLQKIFTPATDAEEILPNRNRKADIIYGQQHPSQYQENNYYQHRETTRTPLKLFMDPRGTVQDIRSQGITYDHSSGLLSPDKCAELVSALHSDAPKGKGAELFAKRRKRSEKWIVDETNAATRSPSGVPGGPPVRSTPTPAFTDAGTQRVQANMKMDQIQAKYAEPRVKLVRSPWDAALETGFANNAFQDSSRTDNYSSNYLQQSYTPQNYSYPSSQAYPQHSLAAQPNKLNYGAPNSQRELAYKPSVPQGWNAPPAHLPRDLCVPPEIPLSGYAPPQTGDIYSPYPPNPQYPHSDNYYSDYSQSQYSSQPYSSPQSNKNYYNPPSHYIPKSPSAGRLQTKHIYSPQSNVQNLAPTQFNPSPIPAEKLAIFEPEQLYRHPYRRPLTVPNQIVRNVSPTPFVNRAVRAGSSGPIGVSSNPGYNDYYQPSSYDSNRNRYSGCSFASSSTNYSQQSPRVDLSQAENYNRAARGWGQNKDYYRPISFSRQPVELPYTDF